MPPPVEECGRALSVAYYYLIYRLFLLLFSQFELSHSGAQLLLKLMDIRYLVSATPPTMLSRSF